MVSSPLASWSVVAGRGAVAVVVVVSVLRGGRAEVEALFGRWGRCGCVG